MEEPKCQKCDERVKDGDCSTKPIRKCAAKDGNCYMMTCKTKMGIKLVKGCGGLCKNPDVMLLNVIQCNYLCTRCLVCCKGDSCNVDSKELLEYHGKNRLMVHGMDSN